LASASRARLAVLRAVHQQHVGAIGHHTLELFLRFILDGDFVKSGGGDLPELLFGQLDVLFFLAGLEQGIGRKLRLPLWGFLRIGFPPMARDLAACYYSTAMVRL
jgi:hypothetical protein